MKSKCNTINLQQNIIYSMTKRTHIQAVFIAELASRKAVSCQKWGGGALASSEATSR